MLKKTALCVLVLALAFVATPAGYTDLSATATVLSDNHVSVSVHNTSSAATSARVTLTVVLDDGTSQTLTSPNFSVDGDATNKITLTATRNIVGIGDDPQPFPSL